MKHARRAGVLLGFLLAACTWGDSGTHGEPTPPPSAVSASPTTLSRLVLTADLSERPSAWHRVVSIPFGDRSDQLGFLPSGRHGPVPLVPIAFAVANDGSLWFLDAVKHRLAHYSSDGRYLGEVGRVPFDPFHPEPRDIAMAGAIPVVLQTGRPEYRGIVLVPRLRGGSRSVTIHDEKSGLYVSNLIQTSDRSSSVVLGLVEGRSFHLGEEPTNQPQAVADLGLSSGGRAHLLAGQPLGDGGFAFLRIVHFTDLEATFVTASGSASILPIHFRLTAGSQPIPAVAGAEFQTALEHGVACLIQIAPNSLKDSRRYGGGRWFLELADDGSPLVWERLREPRFDDEGVVRHLAAAPDGSVYLMQVDRRGVSIYER